MGIAASDKAAALRHTMYMESSKIISIRIALTVAVAACCIVFIGLCFTPRCDFAYADSVDPEAVEVLERCAEYVEKNPFRAYTSGFINARVFGIPCRQSLIESREVNGKAYHAVDESRSPLANAAFDRCSDGERHTVKSAKYKNKAFVYGEPEYYTDEEYFAVYGAPPIGLTKFDLTRENIISAARVDNDTFVYTLEPASAQGGINLIKKIANAKAARYEFIEITLITDGEKPIAVSSVEKFVINKLGGLNCTAEFTEEFEF